MSILVDRDVFNPNVAASDLSLVERFRMHDVAKISDAMAKYGTFKSCVKPLEDSMRICGTAVTVQCEKGDWKALERAAERVGKGEVMVVDAGGFESVCVCGIELVDKLSAAGAAGLVVNGAVRDRLAIIKSGFPVFARTTCNVKTEVGKAVKVNVPINGAGLVVYPGDLIVGDDDGVVAVPYYDFERVLKLTDAKLEHELANQAKIRAGAVMTVLYGCEAKIDKWREAKA